MTDQELNIKIAEALGYKNFVKGCEWEALMAEPPDEIRGSSCARYFRVPDYCNDLNAIIKAVDERVRDEQEYVKMLAKVIAGCPDATRAGGTRVIIDTIILVNATARQRAEAFVKLLTTDNAYRAKRVEEVYGRHLSRDVGSAFEQLQEDIITIGDGHGLDQDVVDQLCGAVVKRKEQL